MTDVPLASRLEGKLITHWEVLEKRMKSAADASGAFSSCYHVRNVENGREGFLKAFNYKYAFDALQPNQNSADFLKSLTSNFVYERDLLLLCGERKMSRVVVAMDHGEYFPAGEIFPVPYLVFEIADGSLKNVMTVQDPQLAWKLGAFHGFLVGLSQLHYQKIAHQDIKPSNILIFGKNFSKLSDLGNATQLDHSSPLFAHDGHCGDWTYAPIELFYGYVSNNWETRRLGADLFMAGGIITYLITDSVFLPLMIANLPDSYRPGKFGGSFNQVKPYLIDAYNRTIEEISRMIPDQIRSDLIQVIAQLNHPVPEERGNPQNLISSVTQYSLQRYISITDRLAKKVEFNKIA